MTYETPAPELESVGPVTVPSFTINGAVAGHVPALRAFVAASRARVSEAALLRTAVTDPLDLPPLGHSSVPRSM